LFLFFTFINVFFLGPLQFFLKKGIQAFIAMTTIDFYWHEILHTLLPQNLLRFLPMSYEKFNVPYKSIEPWKKAENPFDEKWQQKIKYAFRHSPVTFGKDGVSIYKDSIDIAQFCSYLGYVAAVIMLQKQKLLPAKF
jgi:hypothetical protein